MTKKCLHGTKHCFMPDFTAWSFLCTFLPLWALALRYTVLLNFLNAFCWDVFILVSSLIVHAIHTSVNIVLGNLLTPLHCLKTEQRQSVFVGADICEWRMSSRWSAQVSLRRRPQFNFGFRIFSRNVWHYLPGKGFIWVSKIMFI